MPSGFRDANGVDFDDLFDTDVIGDGPTAWDYRRSDGSPLRYAAGKYGWVGPDLGFRDSAGTEVSRWWARKGTAVYKLGFDGLSVSAGNSAKTNSSGTTSATASLYMYGAGTWELRRIAAGGGNSSNVVASSGSWIDAGAGAGEYQILFEQLWGSAVTGLGWYDFTATRTVSLRAAVPSASAQFQELSAGVKATLRRNGVDIKTAAFSLYASASGWV